jgi:hypothetical protein
MYAARYLSEIKGRQSRAHAEDVDGAGLGGWTLNRDTLDLFAAPGAPYLVLHFNAVEGGAVLEVGRL